MMKLVLHIGTEKTGTTSIQKYLHRYSEVLQRQGIYYSKSLGRPNNMDIAVYGMPLDPEEPFFLHRDISGAADHEAFRKRVERDLEADIGMARQAGCHTFVISNEHCHSRLLREENVARVHELVSGLFETCEIACYLRPQVELAVSFASTMARQERVTADFFHRISASDAYYDYHALLARWASVFGRSQIQVIPFKAAGNPVSDFARRIGTSDWQSVPEDRHNASLDVNTIALLNAIEVRPHILSGRLTRHPVPFIDNLPVKEKLSVPIDLAIHIHDQFRDGNARLVEEWKAITLADLEPDWTRFDRQGNLDKLELPSPLPDYLKPLIDGLTMRNWLDEAMLNIANSQRAEARGNLENAKLYLGKAMALTDLVGQSFGKTQSWTDTQKEIGRQLEVIRRKGGSQKAGQP